MITTQEFYFHAAYVTFVYACIGIGALVYRTIVDHLNVKDVRLGEELYLLYDPRAFIGIGCLAFFFCIFVFILQLKTDLMHEEVDRTAPGLIFAVIPMVLVVNMAQVFFRAKWQRLSVRTGGILIRRMLSERFFAIPFDEHLAVVQVQRESLWFKLVFFNDEGELVGSCNLSAKSMLRLTSSIQRACDCIIDAGDIPLASQE